MPSSVAAMVTCAEHRGRSTRSERPQNRKRDHPRPPLLETTRVDGVKALQHRGTPRSYLAHLHLLVVMHRYEVVDVVHGPGSSGQPAPPAATRLPPSGALDLDDSDFSGGFCGRSFRPSCLAWRRSQAPPALACHRPMQAPCKLAFLEGLYSACQTQKSASPRVSKLPFARRVSEQSISSSPAARGKGAITVCG